jgi:hypothetical protein
MKSGIPPEETFSPGERQTTFRILGPGSVARLHQGNGSLILPGKETLILHAQFAGESLSIGFRLEPEENGGIPSPGSNIFLQKKNLPVKPFDSLGLGGGEESGHQLTEIFPLSGGHAVQALL